MLPLVDIRNDFKSGLNAIILNLPRLDSRNVILS
jgi:hypothetical protein